MLEEISESIHAQRKVKRKLNLLREPGVGAEYACDGNSIGAPPELEYDLDECYDRGSVVSGKSSSLGDSADLVSEDFKNVQASSVQAVTRTVSCPENMSIMVKNLSLQNQNTEEETTTNGDTESQIMML